MFGSFGTGFGSFGAGVGGLLPSFANITSWLKAPTTDGKTLANSKGVDATLTAVNCLQFDGNNDHIDLPSVPSDLLQGVFNISFDILIDDSDTGYQRIFWFIGGNDFFRIQKNTGSNTLDFWARNSSSNTIFRNQSMSFTPDVMFNFRAVGDGTDVKVYYDDVLQYTISITAENKQSSFTPANKSLGKDASSFKGKLANFKMSSGSVLHTQLPIAEGSGTKAYDISGNGNHGTIDGATWSTLDGIESWNHEYGFDASAVFDGTDDRIDTGLASDAAVTKASFTIKPENDGANKVIIGLANKSGTGNASTFIGTDNKLKYKARSTGSNLVNRCDTTVLTAGNTYDVVIEYGAADGTGTSVTINGVTQSFTAVNGLTHSGGDLLIGARETGSVNSFYQGEIHSLQLETSSGVIRDFVPSDGKLLDKVNNTYYSNGGSGDIETKRYPALNTTTKQVATFDGVADHVDFASALLNSASTFTVRVDINKYERDFSKKAWIVGGGADKNFGLNHPNAEGAGNYIFFRADDNTYHLFNGSGGTTNTANLNLDGKSIVLKGSGDVLELFIDTVSYGTVTANSGQGVYYAARYGLGYSNTSHAFTGSLSRVALWNTANNGQDLSTALVNHEFQSDIGTTTVQDTTANNNDGTVTVGSGGLDSFWGQRVADASGSLVSADYATGNTTISNPGGFVHNSSECGVKLRSRTVGTFDGEADRLDFTAHTTAVGDVFDFEFDLVSNADDASGSHRCLLSNGVNNYIALLDNDNGRIVVRGDSIQNATGTIKIADGMSTLKVTIDSASQVSVSINGGSTETLSTNFTGIGLSRLMSGAGGIDRFLNANVKSFSITNSSGTKVVDYDFQNDIGTNTVQDLTANNNDGDLTVGSGGTETFWADSYREYSATNLFSHTNGTNNTWVKESGSNITQIGQYDEDETLTSNEETRNDRYFG